MMGEDLMDRNHPNYEHEYKHLEEVCSMLKTEIENKDREISNYKSEIVAIRKNMWENARHGFGGNETEAMIDATQYISAIKNEENSYRFTKGLLDKYRRLYNSPYFARVDFKEGNGGAAEQIYIGLYSFIDTDSMEVVIHDWRAPVSSIFYEYELGAAEYGTREGSVHGEILLKRQFKIKDSRLLYMFDSSVKIDDEMLQEILSGNASEKMKNIVTTIQKEQNRVIRFDEGSMLVVQGAAGSGKTSIALHRIAYLLYKDRNLNSGNIIILSPSHAFNDYISNVLPELGESNVLQTTFEEHISKLLRRSIRVESQYDYMEYLLSSETGRFDETRRKGHRFKSSEKFLHAVRQYADELADKAGRLKDVYYEGGKIVKGSELRKVYESFDKGLPVNSRLASVRERAFYLLSDVQAEKKAELKKKVDDTKASPREAAAQVRIELKRAFKGIKDEIYEMTKIDAYGAYRSFFLSSCFFESGKTFGLTAEELEDISRQSIRGIDNRRMNYEDSAVLAYFKCIVDELPDMRGIKHVVIDEAQDYSPLQYEIFKKLFPESSFTILGDMNQMINPSRNPMAFDSIADVFGRADSAVLKLSKSYRSTKEITEFTRALLPSVKQIEGLNRAGRLPEVIKLRDGSDRRKLLAADIRRMLDEGMKSIAVLCRTSEECSELYKQLKEEIKLSIVAKDDDVYKKGVNIIPSYLCKGLEFDAVLVYGADERNFHTEGDRMLLYTLCTRALHILKVYYAGKLSPIISEVNSRLYKRLEE